MSSQEEINEYELFVSGIALDLTNEGLFNVFANAGPIDYARIIPLKDSSKTQTYGFVKYKSKADAAKAVEMFNNTWLGSRILMVRHATKKNTNLKSGTIKTNTEFSKPKPSSTDDDWENGPTSVNSYRNSEASTNGKTSTNLDYLRARNASRGSLISSNSINEKTRAYDLKRPFFNRVSSGSLSELQNVTYTSDDASSVCYPGSKVIQTLEKDKKYEIRIKRVNNPGDFFIQIQPDHPYSVKKDLLSKLNDALNKPSGDSEMPLFRCKLDGLKPMGNTSAWLKDATAVLEKLSIITSSSVKFVFKVCNIEKLAYDNEKVYSGDLFYDGDSISEFMISSNYAVKTSPKSTCIIKACLSGILFKSEDNKISASEYFYDDEYEYGLCNLPSVSMNDLRIIEQNYEHTQALRTHMKPGTRTKMFNSVYKIWKKRDMAANKMNVKVGLIFDVYISHVSESSTFYALQFNRLGDQDYFEESLNNLAALMINESSPEELFSFQENSNRNDLILVKTNSGKWRRAVFLEKVTSDTFEAYMDHEEDELVAAEKSSRILGSEKKIFYSFFLIDWGNDEQLVKTKRQVEEDLFILPMHEKVVMVNQLAFKCSIDHAQIKIPYSAVNSPDIEKESRWRSDLFEEKFKMMVEKRKFRMRVNRTATVANYETELEVELYFMPEDAAVLIESFEQTHRELLEEIRLETESTAFNMNKDKLSCVQYIKNEILIAKKTEMTQLRAQTLSMTEPSVAQISKESDKTKFVPLQIKLKPEINYHVSRLYLDENMVDKHFYVLLAAHAEKLDQLGVCLQKPPSTSDKFAYIKDLSELRVNQHLEALYDADEKWYRVCVRQLTSQFVVLFFADFGNSQKISASTAQTGSILRIRNKYDTAEEAELLKLDYQAVKCVYMESLDKELDIQVFAEKLATVDNNIELGFQIKTIKCIKNDYDEDNFELTSVSYGVMLVRDHHSDAGRTSETDQEVSSILESSVVNGSATVNAHKQIELEKPSSVVLPDIVSSRDLKKNQEYKVICSHVQGVDEFFVQMATDDKVEKLSQLHENVAWLVTNLLAEEKQANSNLKVLPTFQVGEFVLIKYSLDDQWYRGLILDVINSAKNDSTTLNNAHDYTVYFVDFGNTETGIFSENMRSFRQVAVSQAAKTTRPECLNSVLTSPFSAIVCQLANKKVSDKSTDLLKEVTAEVLLSMTAIGKQKKSLAGNIFVDKYSVNLSLEDGQSGLLNDRFETDEEKFLKEALKPSSILKNSREEREGATTEKLTMLSIPNESKLELGQFYECRSAFVGDTDEEIFVYLTDNLKDFTRLEAELVCFVPSAETDVQFGKGDLVVAKYYENSDEFNWCRAIVTYADRAKNAYQVFYFDYGNSSTADGVHLTRADLARLPTSLDTKNFAPPFAFKIKLSGVANYSQEQLMFLTNTVQIRVLSVQNVAANSVWPLYTHMVEAYDPEKKICMNALINKEYKIDMMKNSDVARSTTGSSEISKMMSDLKLEQSKPSSAVNLSLKKLQDDEIYECQFSYLEAEIFVNLEADMSKFAELVAKLTALESSSLKPLSTTSTFWPGDIVLAKFYEEPGATTGPFSWCRAVINDRHSSAAANTYSILYFDYGNSLLNVRADDLRPLPKEFDLQKYAPFAYNINLDRVLYDFENQAQLAKINEFLTSDETFLARVVKSAPSPSSGLIMRYQVEVWDKTRTSCLNTQLLALQTKPIDQVNIETTTCTGNLVSQYTFLDSCQKPFYFSTGEQVNKREVLDARMLEWYSSSNAEALNLRHVKSGDYIAALSDGSWFRVQVKEADVSSGEWSLLYIDYGYDERGVKALEERDRFRKLDEQFFEIERLAFGGYLVEDEKSKVPIEVNDEEAVSKVVSKFIEVNNCTDQFKLTVMSELPTACTQLRGLKLFPDERYFALEMRTLSDKSLNKMLLELKTKLATKTIKFKKPANIKLTLAQIAAQPKRIQSTDDLYSTSGGSIDSFYVFRTDVVDVIQKRLAIVCDEMVQELDELEFDRDTEMKQVAKGDLVFGMHVDHDEWYRCVVTDINATRTQFSLFLIDFGNLITVSQRDVMYGWREDHLKLFKKHEPQAYHSKLYGLSPVGGASHYSNEQNAQFKNYLSSKKFTVTFVNCESVNENGSVCNKYGISLNEIVLQNKILFASAHLEFGLLSGIVEFPRFELILSLEKEQVDEMTFYTKLINTVYARQTD